MRCLAIGTALVMAMGIAGCTKKTDSSTAANSPSVSHQSSAAATNTLPQSQPIAVPVTASPDQVVTVFLNALRSGDSPTTESLLTSKAREELAKHALSVDVQSAPNAAYQVRPAEAVPGDPGGAHVSSVWTEKFEDGEETYEIVWALRRQNDGWRVAGMAMQLLPGQSMQFLNFEDPEDMLRKKDEALAALQPPAAETAQQPAAITEGTTPTAGRSEGVTR